MVGKREWCERARWVGSPGSKTDFTVILCVCVQLTLLRPPGWLVGRTRARDL